MTEFHVKVRSPVKLTALCSIRMTRETVPSNSCFTKQTTLFVDKMIEMICANVVHTYKR